MKRRPSAERIKLDAAKLLGFDKQAATPAMVGGKRPGITALTRDELPSAMVGGKGPV